MQSLLFLKSKDDGPTDRIINIDLMSMAAPHQDNPEWTRVMCGYADITIHMPFAKFLEKVEWLVQENYRVSLESSKQWHEKRIADSEESMKRALRELMDHHQ